MKTITITAAICAVGVGALAVSPAMAQSASNDTEIGLLKQQLRLLEQKLDKLEQQNAENAKTAASAKAEAKAAVTTAKAAAIPVSTAIPANAAIPTKAAAPPSGVVVTMPGNRPTICTADGQNCVALTSRVHWDVGGYDYRPNSAATSPQGLDDGENLRRARIGVVGKFLGDWNYTLIYDFGGSSDGFGGTAAVAGVAAGFLPGGATSGIEQANVSYMGIKPFGGQLAIDGGYLDVPYTLGEATSSNDIVFMERASVSGHRHWHRGRRFSLRRRYALV